jgi:hypothetical protein
MLNWIDRFFVMLGVVGFDRSCHSIAKTRIDRQYYSIVIVAIGRSLTQ